MSNDLLDEIIEAIRGAWDAAQTPDDLRQACCNFIDAHEAEIANLRAVLLVSFGVWIKDVQERTGTERRVLEQVVGAETYRAIGMMFREIRERDGEKLLPARMAIVAYMMGSLVASSEPFKCDLQAATDHWLQSIENEAAA